MSNLARQFGFTLNGTPGPNNDITDVKGVLVGMTTLNNQDQNEKNNCQRTGVTVILPTGKKFAPVFGGSSVLNGNGEMTGLAWLEEGGFIEAPIAITNTHSVGIVRDSIIKWVHKNNLICKTPSGIYWSMPIVGETFDGRLNDINAHHIKEEHVIEALNSAKSGSVNEGNYGGGTGMIMHEFKGGNGTASRQINIQNKTYTLGVFCQANHGVRRNLTFKGFEVGRLISDHMPEFKNLPTNHDVGSIIVIIATDAPLLPHQLKRIARRSPLGLAKLGSFGANSSGDIFLAFSTANQEAFSRSRIENVAMLSNDEMDPFFEATVDCIEESLINCLLAAETMVGINGNKVHEIPKDKLKQIITTKS